MSEPIEDHDRGLSHDLPTLLSRRRMLGIFGGGLAAVVAGCSSSSSTPAPSSAASTSATSTSAAPTSASATVAAVDSIAGTDVHTGDGGEIPEETGGPFPADGSNGQNVLTETGVVRRDIRSSFGSSTTTAAGVPLTFSLIVSDAGKPVTGAAVYVWHCDREGRYSMYSDGVTDENYLRGVQVTDGRGVVTFASIFPACYDGRWPHIHFEVYPTVADATKASNKLITSQLALPKNVCETVYATSGYEQSVANLSRVSLDSDMVFADGHSLQVARTTGSVSAGYTSTLRVPV